MVKAQGNGNNTEFMRGVRGSDAILSYREPQIAFIGRSNVGKSSCINAITNNSKLARSSGTPGKTQELNFFLVDRSHLFVDFPGYGYARMGEDQAEKLRKMILWYFASGEAKPKLTVIILDAKVGVTEYDIQMMALLEEHKHPFIVIANKIDKLNQKEKSLLMRELQAQVEAPIVYFSAKDKIGVAEARALIFAK
jgi:GTP-binding protein